MKNSRRLRLPGFALAAVFSFVVSCALTSCEGVDTYTQPAAVRVIDASYAASAVKVNLEGALFAANLVKGAFTNYGTLRAKNGATVSVAPVAGGADLISSNHTLLPGEQHSILISDSGSTPATYKVSLLDDQRTAAPAGHSAFRFINQRTKAGAVDIYMVPGGVALANAVPIVSDLAAGSFTGYVTLNSRAVNMIVTAAGTSKIQYSSPVIDLDGGEVRTALIMDTQRTASSPVMVFIGSDVN